MAGHNELTAFGVCHDDGFGRGVYQLAELLSGPLALRFSSEALTNVAHSRTNTDWLTSSILQNVNLLLNRDDRTVSAFQFRLGRPGFSPQHNRHTFFKNLVEGSFGVQRMDRLAFKLRPFIPQQIKAGLVHIRYLLGLQVCRADKVRRVIRKECEAQVGFLGTLGLDTRRHLTRHRFQQAHFTVGKSVELGVKIEKGHTNTLVAPHHGHRHYRLDADAINILHREVFILIGVVHSHDCVRFDGIDAMREVCIGVADGRYKLTIHTITSRPLPHVDARMILSEGSVIGPKFSGQKFQQAFQHVALRVCLSDDA